MYNYILTPNKLTIVGNNNHIQIESSNENFTRAKELLKEGRFDEIVKLVDIKGEIKKYISNELYFENDDIIYQGHKLHNTLVKRIIEFKKDGLDFEPLFNFLKNQLKNPSPTSVLDLYDFIEHGDMPITTDGCFLAYKVVDYNFKDKHSRTFDNSVGMICEMNRDDVDNNRENTCSTGLHVCTFDYVKSFIDYSDHLMIVKVNPRDVVSVPIDYNNAKMRCCKYEVVDEYKTYNVNVSNNKEYFDKKLYNFKILKNKTYILNKCINDNLRKGVKVLIVDIIDDKEVIIRRNNGRSVYKVDLEKIKNCIE